VPEADLKRLSDNYAEDLEALRLGYIEATARRIAIGFSTIMKTR
jgi:hypothetical protein